MTSSDACDSPILCPWILKYFLVNVCIYLNSLTMFGGQVSTSVEMNSKSIYFKLFPDRK